MKCLLVLVTLLLELLRHLSAGLRSCLSDERRLFAVRTLVLAGVALDILLGNLSVFLKKRRRLWSASIRIEEEKQRKQL